MTGRAAALRRRAAALVLTAATVVAVVAVGVGAVHGARTVAALSSPGSVASAALDDAYYACLATQVRSLVRPGTTVEVATADPGDWVTLAKATAPVATLTADPRRAVALLALRQTLDPETPGTCLGSLVVARFPAAGPVRRIATGRGASVTGTRLPPPPVL